MVSTFVLAVMLAQHRELRVGPPFSEDAAVRLAYMKDSVTPYRIHQTAAGSPPFRLIADPIFRLDNPVSQVKDRAIFLWTDPATGRPEAIDADRDPRTGWEGFDFIINRTVEADGTTWLERNAGGWRWEKVGKVRARVSGTELQLAIPRPAIGIPEGPGGLAIDFKWTDNVQQPGDILDFYVSGDVAPEGRYKFRYIAD
jgi:hypothetical protein